jgi:hypothetical protein
VRIEICNGHAVERTTHELTDADAARITRQLAQLGIHVEPVVGLDHVLHLWAKRPCDTWQEVVALRAYHAHHDGRMAWHSAGPIIIDWDVAEAVAHG